MKRNRWIHSTGGSFCKNEQSNSAGIWISDYTTYSELIRYSPFQWSSNGYGSTGIGLYGFAATNNEQQQLQHVATLKTTISQIKSVPSNETIGYSRKGKLTWFSDRDSGNRICWWYQPPTRNGVGSMLVNGKKRQSSAMLYGHVYAWHHRYSSKRRGWSDRIRCRSNSYGNCKRTPELYLMKF